MPSALVIRFGSLGDLCVCGWTISGLADASEGMRIGLATKDRFADLAARMRGVDEVHRLAGSGPAALDDLALRLGEAGPWDRVIDAHDVLRSRMLSWRLRRGPDSRLDKHTARRLLLLLKQRWRGRRDGDFRGSPDSGPLSLRMIDRFDAAAAGAFPAAGAPGADLAAAGGPPPLSDLRPANSGGPILGLAPGAQWNAKRWPDACWASLLREFRNRSGDPARIFLGPRETWFGGSALAAAAGSTPDVEVVRGRSLVEAAAALAECSRVVTNDSGLLHLAEAAGVPVTALFGPTVKAFGYYPLLPDSRAIEIDLPCRPCSRNGKRPCHRGDQACLAGIDPAVVLDDVLESAPWGRHPEGSR